jgi:hypothetical protein
MADRKGRVLIGWLSEFDGASWLRDAPGGLERCKKAREAVAERAPGLVQTGAIQEASDDLLSYWAVLGQHPVTEPFQREGWRLVVADLSKIVVVQPWVLTDWASERLAGIPPSDLLALARYPLPTEEAEQPEIRFDEVRNLLLVSSRNTGLQIIQPLNRSKGQGIFEVGFVIALVPSYMQVILWEGRFIMRDGYHRAYALLASGIRRVPVLFREWLGPDLFTPAPGFFTAEVFLSDRPPTLSDFLDNRVSAQVQMQGLRKVITVQASQSNVAEKPPT